MDSRARASLAAALPDELIRWLAGEAERIEHAGRIPDDVAARLHAAGLFRMVQPVRFGGLGLSLREANTRVFELARGCASCAWIIGLGVANMLNVAKFSAAAQREVFAGAVPAAVVVLTGPAAGAVQVERAGSGIRSSGRWRYASGIEVASHAAVLVPAGAPGADEALFLLVPAGRFAIDHASWNVLGMRGTGSKDVDLADVLVPEHAVMRWAVLQSGGKHPECPNDEPLVDTALTPVNALSVLAPTIGVASAVAEEFCALARSRVATQAQGAMRDDKASQVAAATAEATMSMLRTQVLAEGDLIEARARVRQPLTLEERAAMRMRFAVMARQGLAACQPLFAEIGGSLLPHGTRMERLFRDLHAMSSHFLLQPGPAGEAFGRLLLGLELPAGARV